jgi:hypothetical protein
MPLKAQRLQRWQQILDITRHMRELATTGEWQKIVELESHRKQQLTAFFETPVQPGEVAEVTEGIRDIMHSDGELAQLGSAAKADAAQRVGNIVSGRKAVAAYDHCRK